MTRSSWERRIARAAELEREHPAAAQPLSFYQHIAAFQRDIQPQCSSGESLLAHLPSLLELVRGVGPTQLAAAAERVSADPGSRASLLDRASNEDPTREDATGAFFARVLLQTYTESAASRASIVPSETTAFCPFCNERPVAAVLRPEGEGGKRHLICSLCFTEWEFRRVLCPNCGEEDHHKLPVYTAAEFPHVRVHACDSCHRYIKAIDLTVNGLAVPEVDELAAISLDLWAGEQDYVKLIPNILSL